MFRFTILLIGVSLLAGCVKIRRPLEPRVERQVPTRVLLARHAEAFSNLPAFDTPEVAVTDSLTPEGERQAKLLGESLRMMLGEESFTLVASDTGRAKETAKIVAEELGIDASKIVARKALNPMRRGVNEEGQPVIWSWREENWAAGKDPSPRGGESLGEASRRALNDLARLAESAPGRTIVAISHSDIIAGIASGVEGDPIHTAYQLHKPELAGTYRMTLTVTVKE